MFNGDRLLGVPFEDSIFYRNLHSGKLFGDCLFYNQYSGTLTKDYMFYKNRIQEHLLRILQKQYLGILFGDCLFYINRHSGMPFGILCSTEIGTLVCLLRILCFTEIG